VIAVVTVVLIVVVILGLATYMHGKTARDAVIRGFLDVLRRRQGHIRLQTLDLDDCSDETDRARQADTDSGAQPDDDAESPSTAGSDEPRPLPDV
jgi:hypothetical protein